MPLTITDYKNWARQDQATTVSLTRDSNGIMAEKDRLGFLARTFGGSLKTVRAAVIKDFTRALSARYGSSIAQQAVSIAGLTPTTKLKGWKITEAIQAAKTLRAQMLMSGGRAPDIRLGDSDVPSEVTHFFLADKGNAVTKFLKQRATAVQLLGEMPLTEAEFADFHARVGELAARLVRLKTTGVVPEGVPAADFRRAEDSLVAALYDKDAQVRATLDGNPLAETNLDDYKNIWRDAAANAMVELSEEAQRAGKTQAKEAIDHAISNLYGDPDAIKRFNDSIAGFSHDASKKYVAPFVVNLIRRQLAQEGVRNFKVGTADVVRRIDAGFRKNLNERPWTTVDKSILSSVGSRPVSLRSVIAPAEQLGRENPRDRSDRGLIASRYPARVHGYMCHCSTADHAVNLSVSSIAVGEPGGPQTVAFRGVRHGVHSAWSIRNDAERAAANARRAEEAVIAAFLAKFDDTELPEPGNDGKTVVDLEMTSVSLLTPGTGRHLFKKGSSVDERRMLTDQTAAWEAVEHNGVEFRYKGRTIRVKPSILKFNFGVNEGAVNTLFKIAPDAAGGWDLSSRMNQTAFTALQARVDAFLRSDADLKKKSAVRTLLAQCRQALDARAERSDAHDAFKVAARIAVIANLMGEVPCWNCKSGKDRTGQMDVECKFLSTLIANGSPIPEPGAPLTKAQQGLLRSIALEGGNFEIQKMNTGIAGFKTGRVDSVAERLGGQEYREFHRGGSDHVSV